MITFILLSAVAATTFPLFVLSEVKKSLSEIVEQMVAISKNQLQFTFDLKESKHSEFDHYYLKSERTLFEITKGHALLWCRVKNDYVDFEIKLSLIGGETISIDADENIKTFFHKKSHQRVLLQFIKVLSTMNWENIRNNHGHSHEADTENELVQSLNQLEQEHSSAFVETPPISIVQLTTDEEIQPLAEELEKTYQVIKKQAQLLDITRVHKIETLIENDLFQLLSFYEKTTGNNRDSLKSSVIETIHQIKKEMDQLLQSIQDEHTYQVNRTIEIIKNRLDDGKK